MAALIWDSVSQALTEPEIPLVHDPASDAFVETTGLVGDAEAQAWAKAWNPKKILYLYNNGDECTGVTGGWQCYYLEPDYSGNFAKNSNNLYLSIQGFAVNNNGSAYMGTVNYIDLSPYNKIHIDYSMYNSNSNRPETRGLILLTSKPTNYTSMAQFSFDNSSRIVVEKDVSSFDGLLYVGFRLNSIGGTAQLNIYNVWLE